MTTTKGNSLFPRIPLLIMSVGALGSSGCSKAPSMLSCDDKIGLETVWQIVQEHQLANTETVRFTLNPPTFEAMRPAAIEDAIKKVTCKASLTASGTMSSPQADPIAGTVWSKPEAFTKHADITYTLQATTDQKLMAELSPVMWKDAE